MNIRSSSESNYATNLFNGNIGMSIYSINQLNLGTENFAQPEAYTYKYDQLHRLLSANAWGDSHYYSPLTNYKWTNINPPANNLSEGFTYDPNGNILSAQRYDNTASGLLDNLGYVYPNGTNDNKLTQITDAVSTAYPQDLENQSANNYAYDAIGNLTQDVAAGYNANSIAWTIDQKLKSMDAGGTKYGFKYNPMRERIMKSRVKISIEQETRTYYMRDGHGKLLASYTANVQNIFDPNPTISGLSVNEYYIYGSSRIGELQETSTIYPVPASNPNDPNQTAQLGIPIGLKRYELTNHLRNVLAVVTDRKRGKASTISTGGAIQWFEADMLSCQQYYAFGMLMPNDVDPKLRRQYSIGGYDYRYGFNGKEGDDEIKGDDNQQDYGMRIYDPRVGRFLSVDPLAGKYPWYAPYQFAGNMPIWATDLDGLEEYRSSDGTLLGRSGTSTEIRIIANPKVIPVAIKNLKHKNWNHNWLLDRSVRASNNIDALLNDWAIRNQNVKIEEREFGIKVFKKTIMDENKKPLDLYIEGTTVQGEKVFQKGAPMKLDVSGSKPIVDGIDVSKDGWAMEAMMHSHPHDNRTFSDDYNTYGTAREGDIPLAISTRKDVYLMTLHSTTIKKFNIKTYFYYNPNGYDGPTDWHSDAVRRATENGAILIDKTGYNWRIKN
jgi:RHS repeat-associated protein